MATAEKSIAPTKNEFVNSVMEKIGALEHAGKLRIPPNYSPQNALMSAYLRLQEIRTKDDKPVLQACTPDSIANSLLDMVIQGLNPSKKQCYFIPYGSQLAMQRSYFGTATVAMRVIKAKRLPEAEIVYEGDDFQYEICEGRKRVTKHIQALKNIDKNKIVAAYCTVFPPEGDPFTEIMTWEQVKQAWRQSRQNPFDQQGNLRSDSTHGRFPDEMSKKTVTNRACKMSINTSDDSTLDIVVESVNRTDDAAEEAAFEEEVGQNANSGPVLEAEYVEKPDEGQPAQEEQGNTEGEEVTHEPVTETETKPAPEQGKTATPPAPGQRRKPNYA